MHRDPIPTIVTEPDRALLLTLKKPFKGNPALLLKMPFCLVFSGPRAGCGDLHRSGALPGTPRSHGFIIGTLRGVGGGGGGVGGANAHDKDLRV